MGQSTAPRGQRPGEAADRQQGRAAPTETDASPAAFQCTEGSPARTTGTGTTLSGPGSLGGAREGWEEGVTRGKG